MEAARRAGLRYVHVPVGYDGVPRDAALRVARAVRDLPGPVYLHCHHGRHRGPAAAAVAARCLDPAFTAQAAADFLQAAGTDPRYEGLFASVERAGPATSAEIDAAPADFPEAVDAPGLVKAMVEIDDVWDRLKTARAAGWAVPPGAPDDSPTRPAVLLVEHFREAARCPDAAARGPRFRQQAEGAGRAAADLEAAVRAADEPAAGRAFEACARSCTACHAEFRDKPYQWRAVHPAGAKAVK